MVAAQQRAWLVGSVETRSMVERGAIHKVAMGDHRVAMEYHKAVMEDHKVMDSKQGMVARNEVIHPPQTDIEHHGARAWTIFPLGLRRWLACKDRSY